MQKMTRLGERDAIKAAKARKALVKQPLVNFVIQIVIGYVRI
jgi:hypothetical protein